MTKRDLSIEQMREIVKGAPDDTAEFYSGSYWKTEGRESFIGNHFEGWRRTHWHASTVRHWNMLKLSDLRAAIASHDASITPQDAAAPTVAEVPGQKRHWHLVAYAYRNKTCSGSTSFFAWYQDKPEKLTHSDISTLQETAKNYAGKNHGLDCLEVVIMAVSYLGEMTEAEFYGEEHGHD